MRNQIAVTCDYDELSENNLMNRILKSTVLLLLKQKNVQEKYKSELKKEMLFFSGIEPIELAHIRWADIRFQRNNQTYQLLFAICQLLIEGALLTTESGEYRLAGFIDKQRMERLYEKFILEYYAQEFGARIKDFLPKPFKSHGSWMTDMAHCFRSCRQILPLSMESRCSLLMPNIMSTHCRHTLIRRHCIQKTYIRFLLM